MTIGTPVQVPMRRGDTVTVHVTENPQIVGGVAPIEEWEIYNFTMDAHPIHLHLVRFEVIERRLFDRYAEPQRQHAVLGDGFQGYAHCLSRRDYHVQGHL